MEQLLRANIRTVRDTHYSAFTDKTSATCVLGPKTTKKVTIIAWFHARGSTVIISPFQSNKPLFVTNKHGHASEATSGTPSSQQTDICNNRICEILNIIHPNQPPVTLLKRLKHLKLHNG